MAPADVIAWESGYLAWDRLDEVPPGTRLLCESFEDAERARQQGLMGICVPDWSVATLMLAVADGPIGVPRGTLWTDGRFWSRSGPERLTPRELALVRALLAGHEDADILRSVAFSKRASLRALRSGIARLRARLGGGIASLRGVGWRLVVFEAASAREPNVRPAWRALQRGRFDPERGIAEVGPMTCRLTASEGALLDRLWRAGGRPVTGGELKRAGAPSPATTVHRLRRKLGAEAITTTRGRGYRLPIEGIEAAQVAPRIGAETLAALSRDHALVCVVGVAGAGKTRLMNATAECLRVPVFDVREFEVGRAVRWALRRDPPVLLDGFDNARTHLESVWQLIAAGKHVVLGAREPTGADGEHVVRLPDPVLRDREQITQRFEANPELRALLMLLSFFSGPFSLPEAVAVAGEPVDLEAARRAGLLERTAAGYAVFPEVRDHLGGPTDPAMMDRWSAAVVDLVGEAYLGRPCRKDGVVARIRDLSAALEHLSERGLPIAGTAAVLWSHVGPWAGMPVTEARLAPPLALPLDVEVRAELLAALARAGDVPAERAVAVTQQVIALPCSSDVKWSARVTGLTRSWDAGHGGSLARLDALRQSADDPSDPAPPDLRALLDIVWVKLNRIGPARCRDVLVRALARLEGDRWNPGSTLPSVWVDDARATLLCQLARAQLQLEDPVGAASALAEAQRCASPLSSGLVGLTQASAYQRSGRWAEADRVLDQLANDPARRDNLLERSRILGRQALFAVVAGEFQQALALADQTRAEGDRIGSPHGAKTADRVHAWIAATEGRVADTRARVALGYPQGHPLAAALVQASERVSCGASAPEIRAWLAAVAPSLRGCAAYDAVRALEHLLLVKNGLGPVAEEAR